MWTFNTPRNYYKTYCWNRWWVLTASGRTFSACLVYDGGEATSAVECIDNGNVCTGIHWAGTCVGKLAAMWPLAGIIIEALVLCVIIVVHERKRARQRALAVSDSDNDNAKDTSAVAATAPPPTSNRLQVILSVYRLSVSVCGLSGHRCVCVCVCVWLITRRCVWYDVVDWSEWVSVCGMMMCVVTTQCRRHWIVVTSRRHVSSQVQHQQLHE